MRRFGMVLLLVLVSTMPAVTALGKLKGSDKKEIKAALSGTLYMRMDAPCATGRHPFGVYKRPLVKVSPEGSNTKDTDVVMSSSWWHADSTFWGIRINDPVRLDEVDIDRGDGEIDIELKGVGPADGNGTVVKFIRIRSLEDFESAFEETFSPRPLQEEHPDWPAEIREAIGERRLVSGMNKRQAFYVTGTPERFEEKEEDGKEIEIWSLRQTKGMKTGYFKSKTGESTGLPASIRFEDGQLVNASELGSSSEFDLDDE